MEKLIKHFREVRKPLSDVLKMQLGSEVDLKVRDAIRNMDFAEARAKDLFAQYELMIEKLKVAVEKKTDSITATTILDKIEKHIMYSKQIMGEIGHLKKRKKIRRQLIHAINNAEVARCETNRMRLMKFSEEKLEVVNLTNNENKENHSIYYPVESISTTVGPTTTG